MSQSLLLACDHLFLVMLHVALCTLTFIMRTFASMIEFDNERISVLEKRQAHLMQDNLLTQHEIRTTLKQNEHLTKAIDVLLHAASSSAQLVGCGETRGVEGLMDDMDDVCELLTTQCQLHAEEGGAEGVIDETLVSVALLCAGAGAGAGGRSVSHSCLLCIACVGVFESRSHARSTDIF